ncbi:MAG: hypothetical protein LBS01_08460 [Prevotellaceae bacterium]|nr:hypothetical protein [Prevotellaceae bacterium]
MTIYQISRNCMECFQTEERFYCDVRGLFYQLHIPQQEQTVLMNIAGKKKDGLRKFQKHIVVFIKN